jgi:DNA-binding SARP family transcriptional activator
LRVLGRFAVLTDGGAGPELRISARKGQALLAYLAMHPEHGASREHGGAVLGAIGRMSAPATACGSAWFRCAAIS